MTTYQEAEERLWNAEIEEIRPIFVEVLKELMH